MKLRLYIPLLLCIIAFAACKKEQKHVPTKAELAAEAHKDSLALHVGVYPSEGCLPFYYAEATGIYDSMGVDIRMRHLNAMEDCDTALVRHRIEVSATDLARLLLMANKGSRPIAFARLSESLQLLTGKGKRINDMKQLKERLVAIDRHSEADYWSDYLLDKVGLQHLDIFRTQFNRHKLREEMLTGNLVDAAFLDQPFAAFAKENGAHSIWTRPAEEEPWTVLAMLDSTMCDETRAKQIEKMIEGYNLAVKNLNASYKQEKIDSILVNIYGLPANQLKQKKTLQPKSIPCQPLALVKSATLDKVKSFMVGREQIKSSLNTGSLITTKFLNK